MAAPKRENAPGGGNAQGAERTFKRVQIRPKLAVEPRSEKPRLAKLTAQTEQHRRCNCANFGTFTPCPRTRSVPPISCGD